MYYADVPSNYHFIDIIEKYIKKEYWVSSTSPLYKNEPPPALTVPDTKNDTIFYDYVCKTVCICNIHNHTHTCHKGNLGITECRLCYPCPFCEETQPIQLHNNSENKNSFIIMNVSSPNNNNTVLENIVCKNDRIIFWEIKRSLLNNI